MGQRAKYRRRELSVHRRVGHAACRPDGGRVRHHHQPAAGIHGASTPGQGGARPRAADRDPVSGERGHAGPAGATGAELRRRQGRSCGRVVRRQRQDQRGPAVGAVLFRLRSADQGLSLRPRQGEGAHQGGWRPGQDHHARRHRGALAQGPRDPRGGGADVDRGRPEGRREDLRVQRVSQAPLRQERAARRCFRLELERAHGCRPPAIGVLLHDWPGRLQRRYADEGRYRRRPHRERSGKTACALPQDRLPCARAGLFRMARGGERSLRHQRALAMGTAYRRQAAGEGDGGDEVSITFGRHSGAPRSGEPGIHNHGW